MEHTPLQTKIVQILADLYPSSQHLEFSDRDIFTYPDTVKAMQELATWVLTEIAIKEYWGTTRKHYAELLGIPLE